MAERQLKPELTNVSHEAVYNFLTSYYLYQDELSWGRTQLLLAIEAGALAAAFAIHELAAVTLVVGILLVAIIWRIVERDWEIRDQSLELLDTVHEPLGIRIVKPPRGKWWRGSFLLRFVFAGLMALDALLAGLFVLAAVCRWDALAPFR